MSTIHQCITTSALTTKQEQVYLETPPAPHQLYYVTACKILQSTLQAEYKVHVIFPHRWVSAHPENLIH